MSVRLHIKLGRARETFQSSTYNGHKNAFDVGLVSSGRWKGERLGTSGAAILDGWAFGLKKWARMKDHQRLQKYVTITWRLSDDKISSWEYYAFLKDAKDDAVALEGQSLVGVFDRKGRPV